MTSITSDGIAFAALLHGSVRLLEDSDSPIGEIVVTYVADDNTTPDDLRGAILSQVAWFYDVEEADKRGAALSPDALQLVRLQEPA